MLDLRAVLDARREQSLYRQRRVLSSPQGVQVIIDGQRLMNFASNDYLGLANHPEIVAALKQGADKYGVGSGAAHLISGHSEAHHLLEQDLAEYTGRERALLFSTGYMANIGTISALCGRKSVVFEDRLNHASLIDGGLHSGARFRRYAHGDVDALEKDLSQAEEQNRLIVSDAVFSMDGDIAPLEALSRAAKNHQAWLMVDDAHGFGVLGEQGSGSLHQLGLNQAQVPVYMATLGKAIGSFGAFVAGSEDLIEFLIQEARTYVYTTAMPAALAHATRTALRLTQQDQWRRERLNELITRFRHGAEQLELKLMSSSTPIQPVLIEEDKACVAIGRALMEKGFYVGVVRPPTVPKGTARLRITFSANHQVEDVDRLLQALAEVIVQ